MVSRRPTLQIIPSPHVPQSAKIEVEQDKLSGANLACARVAGGAIVSYCAFLWALLTFCSKRVYLEPTERFVAGLSASPAAAFQIQTRLFVSLRTTAALYRLRTTHTNRRSLSFRIRFTSKGRRSLCRCCSARSRSSRTGCASCRRARSELSG